MLDNETKRRIDKARDILVGKIPDPKSQVEQITIALIYKFMDDMDVESVELGGAPSFFTDAYQKYAWRELLKPTMGGNERLNLYGEAIAQMNQNPELPQLFRDIFKNAYLPYRDPETLTMFLKTIDEFNYDHSERLGDAFEYLLSVLGSQGDAGQFRTPRHIIDFMAAVVQPKKTDVIGDPACGTAGFLIAAYKFILAQNKNALNDVERKQLAQNLIGYDISPDMVRLSRVNLFLHRFVTPTIFEYDTLTSQEKWGDYFDVILANPPFMSPRGGITPHKRFSVQSNRSEVLFVDYIAEHLKPEGRAGIIVPEGIIFQSANAYKQLREMLVKNNYLYAVVSLPAGVFNPYSGVKTSILFIDKSLAKKTDNILFVKITSDGFDLGAQRRANNTSDLTAALDVLNDYKTALRSNSVFENTNPIGVVVPKEKIAENGDYNLSADRYKITLNAAISKFEMVKLGEVCTLVRGSSPRPQGDPLYFGGNVPRLMIADVTRDGMFTIPKIDFLTDEGALKSRPMKKGEVVMAVSGNPGLTTILDIDACIHDGFVGFRDLSKSIHPTFLYHILCSIKDQNNSQADGAVFRNLTTDQVKNFEIPLPPLEIQRAIVSEIENYQRIIDGAKQVVQNYKPTFHIEPEWEMVKLGEVLEKVNDSIDPQKHSGLVKYIGLENIESQSGNLVGEIETEYSDIKSTKNSFKKGDILYGKLRPNLNKVFLSNFDGICSTDIFVFRQRENISNSAFYSSYLKCEKFNLEVLNGIKGAQLPRVGFEHFSEIEIPLPSLETQKEIVAAIEREQSLVNANKELIVLMEAKIACVMARVWR